MRRPARDAGRSRAGWLPGLLWESGLLSLQRCVPEGGDDDELVTVPLAGLGEPEVERLSCRGDTVPLGRVIAPVNVPVTLVTTVIQSPSPNWIGYGVVNADVRKHPDQLLHARH